MKKIKLSLFKQKMVSMVVISALTVGSLGSPILARAEADGAISSNCCQPGPRGDSCREAVNPVRDAQAILRGGMINRVKPVPASVAFSQSSCLDTLMNTRININFSVMAADAIIQAIINSVKNAACGAVMGSWNQALSKVNGQLGTAISIPGLGNVIQGSAGTGYGTSSSAVNIQGNGMQNAGNFATDATAGVNNAGAAANSGLNAASNTASYFGHNASSASSSASSFGSKIRGLFN